LPTRVTLAGSLGNPWGWSYLKSPTTLLALTRQGVYQGKGQTSSPFLPPAVKIIINYLIYKFLLKFLRKKAKLKRKKEISLKKLS